MKKLALVILLAACGGGSAYKDATGTASESRTYDRFKDQTAVSYEYSVSSGEVFRLSYLQKGTDPTAPPTGAMVAVALDSLSDDKRGWLHIEDRQIAMLVDGKSFVLPAKWDGKTERYDHAPGHMLIETVVAAGPIEEGFRQVFGGAQTLEVRVGSREFKLTPAAMQGLRTFVNGIPKSDTPPSSDAGPTTDAAPPGE
jgi:hypothetical protein